MLDIKNIVYVVIFIIIICVSHQYIKYKLNEPFIPSFSLITEQKSDVLKLSYPYTVETNDINMLLRNIKNITYSKTNDNEILNKYEDAVILDAFTLYDNRKHSQTLKFLSGTNSEKCAYFIRSLDVPSKTFNDDNIVIGYVNSIDVKLINILFNSLKSNKKATYSVKRINIDSKQKIIDKSIFEKNKIDILFIYESLESKIITKRLDSNMKLEVWDYADNVDIHTLKVQIPFIRKKNIDFSLHFPQLKGKLDIVSSVYVIDVIIVINDNKTSKKNITSELNNIILYYNKPELINLYEQYFLVAINAKQFAEYKNVFFTKRDTMEILEQFKDKSNVAQKELTNGVFTYDVSSNVNSFFDSFNKLLYVYSNTINGIPLKTNDLFQLSGQLRDEQNGLYRVLTVSRKQSTLLKLDQRDKVIDSNDVGYTCYNNPSIKSKTACESLYDELGNPKRIKTYWDKPCETHRDCPFYQANKNYNNYRGGCIDGRCEFPIGIQAVSYRLYDKNTKPVCHNCNPEDANSPNCCEKQKNKSVYPKLLGADYAFELDSFERLYAKTL